jgi:CheY-like chemotaxis protein
MSKRFAAVALLVLSVVSSRSDLLACGDKFLLMGRGTRFQRFAVQHPAAILVYVNPASNLPKALSNLPVEAILRKEGHQVALVTNSGELARMVQQGNWDLVIVDVTDGEPVSSLVSTQKMSPVVLPVVSDVTDVELAQVKKAYRCVLKSPAKRQSFLAAIDAALALKETERASDAKPVR